MNWKGCGRKRSWPNLKVLSRHLRGETEGNDGKIPVSALPMPPTDYEAGVLTARPRRSVFFIRATCLTHHMLDVITYKVQRML
jgi:hypothetical protein